MLPRRLILCLTLLSLAACSHHRKHTVPHFHVSPIGLDVPRLAGWVPDPSVKVKDPTKGGVVFRLIRESAVPGSPRIDVIITPKSSQPTHLETFLDANLREMAEREDRGEIRITEVQREPVTVGVRRAYRVRHEYTMGQGSGQWAITQVSTLFVLSGRGVAVNAFGRTELFHPLADQIDRILSGLSTPVPASHDIEPGVEVQQIPPPKAAKHSNLVGSDVKPIDLGKIGGN